MSRLMDAWNTEIEEKKEPKAAESKNKPSATEIPTVEPAVKMTANDFIYCNMLSKEMNEQGLCGGDVSSLIAYLIKQSRALNPELSDAAEAIYRLQTTRRRK